MFPATVLINYMIDEDENVIRNTQCPSCGRYVVSADRQGAPRRAIDTDKMLDHARTCKDIARDCE